MRGGVAGVRGGVDWHGLAWTSVDWRGLVWTGVDWCGLV